jgi:hypothetical protein
VQNRGLMLEASGQIMAGQSSSVHRHATNTWAC